MKKHKDDSSFYCGSKQCRKSAWDTPEYLTTNDWLFCGKVIEVLESGTGHDLFSLLYGRSCCNQWDISAFFNRVVGWPEGARYCQKESYVVTTAFDSLKQHSLSRLKKAYSQLYS